MEINPSMVKEKHEARKEDDGTAGRSSNVLWSRSVWLNLRRRLCKG